MKTIKIYSYSIQNYLEENGVRPLYEDYKGEAAVYKRCKKLFELLESYEIRKIMRANRR